MSLNIFFQLKNSRSQLIKKLHKNLIIIFLLGISAGIPLALILSTLKATLLESGFDLKTIGFFSLISLPYSLKIFFAPIMDSFAVPILTRVFGQRKSWIILSQIFLAIFIMLLGVGTIFSSLSLIAVFAVLIAFASASQDIVIDGYRIELLKKEDQGIAASFYVYGYRIGLLISGAGALIMAEIIGWNAVYFLIGIFMILAIFITIAAEESRKDWKQEKYNFKSWFQSSVIGPFKDFAKHNKWAVILAFVVLFKLGDAFAGNLTLPFLLDIGFSKIQIASIVKTFGLFATLFGVFAGGLLVKKIGIIKSLWIAGIAQMLSNLAFSYLSFIGNDANALYFVIFIENFSGGIGDSVFIAYLSSLCTVAFSATQYSLLISFATISRSLLSSWGGIVAQKTGWYDFFIFSAILALPGLIFLFWLTSKKSRD